MVVIAVYVLGVSQFDPPIWPTVKSHFTIFVLGTSVGRKFAILVEDSDTGGPSLI